MGKPITDWEVETGGTLGVAAEYTPVEYPRSDENRGQTSRSNKGAASRSDSIQEDRALNTTGDVNSPRRDASVDYEAGPYPEGVSVNEETGGIDEGDGASR